MKRLLVGLVVAVVLSLSAGSAQAQLMRVEMIGVVVLPDTPFEMFFPNDFDPFTPKLLTFEGAALGLTDVLGQLQVSFDWLDLTGAVQIQPVGPPIPVVPGQITTIPLLSLLLPFCPPQVSLHLESTVPVQIQGAFTHECLVPEPSSLVLLGLGSLGMVGYVYRRRQRVA